jgi:hypothetical protein
MNLFLLQQTRFVSLTFSGRFTAESTECDTRVSLPPSESYHYEQSCDRKYDYL